MNYIPNMQSQYETMLQPMERGQITLPKAIRDAAGITSETWLWVRYTPSGKIEVEVAKKDELEKPSLVKALMKLKKLKEPLWTDGDQKRYEERRELSRKQMQKYSSY